MNMFSYCCRFDWEDKLLEKTIRSEIMMETYLKNMNNAMESIAGLKDDYKDIKVNIDNAIGEYRALIDQQNQRIDQVHVIKEPTIAFNVRDAKDLSPQKNEIIQFKTILLNAGGGFDETTGIFTSPVNGTFIFSMQVSTNNAKWGVLQLVCDTIDNEILRIAHYNPDVHSTTTSGTVAHALSQGQMVWVQSLSNSGSTQTLRESVSYGTNQFSGVLVH